MKDRFFYNKEEMVILLNVLKPYPLVQINAALNQLTEDKNEYIVDKYGRLGHLINIGDLYLFQPLELKNKRNSVYERSTPLYYNHDKIKINFPKELKVNEAIIKLNEDPENEKAKTYLYQTIEAKYNLVITDPVETIVKGEKNWYKLCNKAIKKMKKMSDLNENTLLYLVAEHIIDELRLPDIVFILNEINTNPIYETEGVFPLIKRYITKHIMTGKHELKGFLWKESGKSSILVKEKDREQWRMAEAEDIKDLELVMTERKTKLIDNLNTLIGFMNDFKSENYTVFKTKFINSPRVLGARCDQNSSISKSIELLNSIIGRKLYTSSEDLSQRQICIIQELYLRLFENEKKNNKHWFLSPADAVLTNIEKYTIVKKLK
jgi:hypothetical protein